MKAGVLATMSFCALIAYPIASFAGLAPDADADGIPDVLDKCVLDSRNVALSCDTDNDGYGNPCDADFNQDGVVDSRDFGMFFLPAFRGGSTAQGEDMNCDGVVDSRDFGMFFLPKFRGALGGAVAGPSGLACAGVSSPPCN